MTDKILLEPIHIGFSRGQSVDIRLLHTIVAAQTRYGKSTTIRTMMQHIPDDYKALCLDVKDPRDFEGAGTEIPIFIENKTDPLMLKQLLEQESHLWLRREFPELIDLCKEGDTFEKVYERVNKRMTEKVHPVVKDRLKVLQLLLRKLVENMAKTTLSDTLELPAKNNVMNLSKSPSEIKQLSVYSVVKRVLEQHENVILVIDELPDFAPQQYSTPSKSMIGQAIRKGGAKGIWLWLSGQTMTGVDKQVLKQAMIWILGHQREINEAKRTLDQIPFKTGLDVKDIMTLPVGSFVVCTDEGAYITYVQPEGIDSETAMKVSLGEVSVNEVIEMMKKEKGESDESLYKEENEKLKAEIRFVNEEMTKLRQQLETDLKTLKHLDEQTFKKLQEENLGFKQQLEQDKGIIERLEKENKAVVKIREGLAELMATTSITSKMPTDNMPSGILVVTEQPALTIQKHTPPLTLDDSSVEGKIAILYAEGNLPQDKWFTVSDIYKAFQKHGWNQDPHTREALDKFCQWGYFEKQLSGRRPDYRTRMSPDDARSKDLLKEVEG